MLGPFKGHLSRDQSTALNLAVFLSGRTCARTTRTMTLANTQVAALTLAPLFLDVEAIACESCAFDIIGYCDQHKEDSGQQLGGNFLTV